MGVRRSSTDRHEWVWCRQACGSPGPRVIAETAFSNRARPIGRRITEVACPCVAANQVRMPYIQGAFRTGDKSRSEGA
jgi:hypothetical protein